MRRIFLFVLILKVLPICADKNETLCIYTKDGEKEVFFFQKHPKIVISDNNLELSTTDQTVIYSLDRFERFCFEIITTSIDTKENNFYNINNNIVNTSGYIIVYDALGRVVLQDRNGTADFSNIPNGLYIVKSSDRIFKYLKK